MNRKGDLSGGETGRRFVSDERSTRCVARRPEVGRLVWPFVVAVLWGAWVSSGFAAERLIEFDPREVGRQPDGFESLATGVGKPGRWEVLMDEIPPVLERLTPQAPVVTRQAVVAQVARDITDEHFPLLMLTDEAFGDFKLVARFKMVAGAVEQMAGIAFRIKDEKNYYVVRASALGDTFRFYKFVDGLRSPPVGPEMTFEKGVWYTLTLECRGNRIRCEIDGKPALPELTDTSFTEGRIGFWTKSDSVSYFGPTKMIYTPRVIQADRLIREAMEVYPRVLGMKMWSTRSSVPFGTAAAEPEAAAAAASATPTVIASTDESELGQPGDSGIERVLREGILLYGDTRETVAVTLPVRDRNGDPVAVLRVRMKRFAGQTKRNAIVRAQPIAEFMSDRVRSREDLFR